MLHCMIISSVRIRVDDRGFGGMVQAYPSARLTCRQARPRAGVNSH
jgi:hypothetical protein